MTRSSPPQVAFSAGEIDPLLHRRFDYQRYQSGLAECHGFLPLPQGAFTRAPGSTVLGRTRGDQPAILVPFQFAADDAVVLEFTAGWMRVWRYGALVLKPDLSGPYELAVPFLADDLVNLRWVQSADVIYLVDGMRPMQRLSRLALNDWTIAEQVIDNGPFRTQNLDESLTLTPSASTGTITLTASAALFEAGHVGGLFEMKVTNNTTVPLWQPDETGISVGDRRRYGRNVYELTAGTNSGLEPPVHDRGEQLYQNGIRYLFISDDIGVVRITAVTSATIATAVVEKRLPDALLTNPTYRWSEGAWSGLRGYPSAIEIFDQRLVAAATPSDPRTVWFSSVGGFSDFEPSVEADGAFSYTIGGDVSQNRITGLRRGGSGLHIFALSEQYVSVADSRSQVIGPTNAVFRLTGSSGASRGRAVAPSGDPLFIARDRRKLIQVRYDLQSDRNREVNLTRASQHIGDAGFEKVIWQQTPEPRAWLLRSVGDLAVMIYDDAEEILGWSTHSLAQDVTAGSIEDLATTQNEDGSEDQLFCVVARRPVSATPDPAFIRTVERLDFGHHLCGAVVFPSDANPAPVASVLAPWLAGRAVLVDGIFAGEGEDPPYQAVEALTADVDTGLITFPGPMLSGVVGVFDASHRVQTLDIHAAAPDGSSLGRNKRLHSPLGLGLHETQGGSVQVIEDHPPGQSVPARAAVSILRPGIGQAAAPAFTGVVEIDAPSGGAKGVSLLFRPEGNAALTVTGLFPTIQEAGR